MAQRPFEQSELEHRRTVVAPNAVLIPGEVISIKLVKLLSIINFCIFCTEYCLLFLWFPFSEIQNCPKLFDFSTPIMVCTVIVCICLSRPIVASVFPTKQMYFSHMITFFCQLLNLSISLAIVIILMKLQGPLEVLSQEEYHTISQDVTTFLRVVSIISLVVNSFGTFFTCISTYILGIGLFRVANRIVRDEENESASVFELSPSVYFEASHVDALRSSQLCEQIQLEFIR